MSRHNHAHPRDYRLASICTDGLVPAYAIRIGRLAGDREWLQQIVPYLRECAEWIRSERRATVNATGLHRGLLAKHLYGGDIHDPAYSLALMVHLWRGLRDTGGLLKELGDGATAKAYLQEAAEFKGLLLRLMRKSRFTRQKPTSVSGMLYWSMPYDYNQFKTTAILDFAGNYVFSIYLKADRDGIPFKLGCREEGYNPKKPINIEKEMNLGKKWRRYVLELPLADKKRNGIRECSIGVVCGKACIVFADAAQLETGLTPTEFKVDEYKAVDLGPAYRRETVLAADRKP